ncbi:FMN-dependent NADH-azoreductase [Clostridium saccharoperbutylacetonicum]|nr:FMN-dependent NADH-azoreductase [Clostridium saccharoperbutylacetonicum]
MGIKRFEELLVDNTGTSEAEKTEAIQIAMSKIDSVIDDVWR